MYRSAIANGLVEVLSVYRSAVLQIEQKLLSDLCPFCQQLPKALIRYVANSTSFVLALTYNFLLLFLSILAKKYEQWQQKYLWLDL